MCVTRCRLKPEAWQKAFGQSWQWCNWISSGLSFWCLRMWTFNASRCVKLFSQLGHWNGFWPEWVIKWRRRISFWANALWHMLQPNGFSPVWVLSCRIRADLVGNHFSQAWHVKPRCWLWTDWWLFNMIRRLKALGHLSHWKGLSSSPLSVRIKFQADEEFFRNFIEN